MNLLAWLAPTLMTLFLYGIGQGLVKKNIGDVPPARFCLYYVVAKAIVNLGFFFTQDHPPLLAPDAREFMLWGLLAYSLEGLGWILYFESIVAGPITIVGTLSAAYSAPTVLFGFVFLGEVLRSFQYLGVALVILGCVGLSYSPADATNQVKGKRWIPLAVGALLVWGLSQTASKYAYGLAGASEVNMAFFGTIGGFLTLGLYGFLRDKGGDHTLANWGRSFLPMAMMAGGDLGVIIANRYGPISLITPISSAYPVVTIIFASYVLREKITKLQYAAIALVMIGMFLAPRTGG
ncbi:MAG: DMT family transporter [Elusimicrobia bacterium]|nr:DMT family transporter [Elusimicrobiota bacterium]